MSDSVYQGNIFQRFPNFLLRVRATGRFDVAKHTTTDASATDIPNFLIPLASGQSAMNTFRVSGVDVATGDAYGGFKTRGIKNVAGTVSNSGLTGGHESEDASMTGANAFAAADNTNKGIKIVLTGKAGMTIKWTVEAETTFSSI